MFRISDEGCNSLGYVFCFFIGEKKVEDMNQLAYHIRKERYCKRTPALIVTVLRKFQSILVINSGKWQ